jgi:VanZ family protein
MNHPEMPMNEVRRPTLLTAWLPVFLWLAVITAESTQTMGSGNTSRWLLQICHLLWGQADGPSFETIHFLLRKLGHLCGYGLLSALFFRAWVKSLQLVSKMTIRQLHLTAARLAVACTFVIACLDELHQRYLPGRTSSFHDVLIDTSGAVLFTVASMLVLVYRENTRYQNAEI